MKHPFILQHTQDNVGAENVFSIFMLFFFHFAALADSHSRFLQYYIKLPLSLYTLSKEMNTSPEAGPFSVIS